MQNPPSASFSLRVKAQILTLTYKVLHELPSLHPSAPSLPPAHSTCHPPCLEISSSRPVVLKQGTSQRILSGDIFSCYSWIEDATGIWWVEATDAAKHPAMHRKVPHNRVIPSKNFPGGPVVKNPLANARDTGLIPGPGRSHLPRGD